MKQQVTQIASNIMHAKLMQSACTYESWLVMQVATNTLHRKTSTLKTWSKNNQKDKVQENWDEENKCTKQLQNFRI